MLSAVGIFDQTLSDVDAHGGIIAYAGPNFDGDTGLHDYGYPAYPNEVDAFIGPEDASASYGAFSSGGNFEMGARSLSNESFAYTSSFAVFDGYVDDAQGYDVVNVRSEGDSRSDGEYGLAVSNLADDPKYTGYVRLSSYGTVSDDDGTENHLNTSHYVEITTTNLIETNTWYIRADPSGGYNDIEWTVEYDLPGYGHVGPYVHPYDYLYITIPLEWDYDESFEVTVSSRLQTEATTRKSGEGFTPGHAQHNWVGSSEALIWVNDEPTVLQKFIPGGLPIIPTSPPKVSNVTISSSVPNSYGTNPPYSFQSVDGSQEQLRTVPVGGANKISVQFTKDVVVDSDDLQLIALNRVVQVPSATLTSSPSPQNNFTATWTLAASLPAAQYLLRLDDSIVSVDRGTPLDGDWTNPGSILSNVTTTVFPSGNGVEGGNFDFVFTYLPGDASRNLWVDVGDLAILSANFNSTSKSWSQGDFTGEGNVNVGDLSVLSSNMGFDWRNLVLLGDYDGDFDLQEDDETEFLLRYDPLNYDAAADLNQDDVVNSADFDAFYALYEFGGIGIDLKVAT